MLTTTNDSLSIASAVRTVEGKSMSGLRRRMSRDSVCCAYASRIASLARGRVSSRACDVGQRFQRPYRNQTRYDG
jgi:hypothetical protein